MPNLTITSVQYADTPPINRVGTVSIKNAIDTVYGGVTSVVIRPDGTFTGSVTYPVELNTTYNIKVQLDCGTIFVKNYTAPINPPLGHIDVVTTTIGLGTGRVRVKHLTSLQERVLFGGDDIPIGSYQIVLGSFDAGCSNISINPPIGTIINVTEGSSGTIIINCNS